MGAYVSGQTQGFIGFKLIAWNSKGINDQINICGSMVVNGELKLNISSFF